MTRSTTPARGLIAGLLVALLALTGCAPAEPKPTVTAVTIPDTPVGQTVTWILEEFNGERDTTPATWEPRLHPTFINEVTADEVADLINQNVRPAKPIIPTAYEGAERDAVVTMAGEVGDPFDLTVSIDDAGLITTLWLGPASAAREPAESLDEVRERFEALPGDVRVLVRTGDGADLIAIDPEVSAPLGSIFKLYVLGAVASAIDDGRLTWEDPLVITDELRSLPSGQLQDAAAGTEVTVLEAAQKMIAISDNTATDLLIHAVGRDAVEQAVTRMDHHDPQSLRPFLTTRELFALRLGGHDDLADRWRSGDEAERRTVLAELDALPFDVAVDDLTTTPGWHDMEWFATASDIATAQQWLHDTGSTEVRDILTANPGLIVPGGWTSVAFKGGSEPGVLAGSWLAERPDGSTVTIVVLASSDEQNEVETNAGELFGLAHDVLVLEAE